MLLLSESSRQEEEKLRSIIKDKENQIASLSESLSKSQKLVEDYVIDLLRLA